MSSYTDMDSFKLTTNELWGGVLGSNNCQGLTENIIKTYPGVLWKFSWTLFVLTLPTLALANTTSKGFGFKTASGMYFVHFTEEKGLLKFWMVRFLT